MAESSKQRVSLTAAQIREGLGAELFSICEDITADGKLSKDEVVTLGQWLRVNRAADLPGIAHIATIFDRIIADGRISREEASELLEAMEKVLPPDARKGARAARKAVEAKRKAEAKVEIDQQRRQERERELRRWPAEDFDFMLAGTRYEGRDVIINRSLKVGERVRLATEPDNPADESAVAVHLFDGRKIGYVPRSISQDVCGCVEDEDYHYVANVKKILTGGQFPVPVIVAKFFASAQLGYVADLSLQPCVVARPYSPPAAKPAWKFW